MLLHSLTKLCAVPSTTGILFRVAHWTPLRYFFRKLFDCWFFFIFDFGLSTTLKIQREMLGKVLGSEQESSCLYLHFYYFAYRCLRLLNQVVREFSREWLNMYGQQVLWRLVGFYFLQQGEMGHSLWSKNPMKDKLLSGYIVSKKCLCPRPAEYKFGQLRARIKYKLWKS